MNVDELMANSWIKMEFIGIIKLAQVNAKCSFLGTKLIYDALCAHWRERWQGLGGICTAQKEEERVLPRAIHRTRADQQLRKHSVGKILSCSLGY